jgi:F0F1-type ATP synthase assembly protein I
MPREPLDSRDLGYYFTIAQVGLEMAVPVGVGAWLDGQFGWSPWGVVVGAVLGLGTGLTHLVALSNRHTKRRAAEERPPREQP